MGKKHKPKKIRSKSYEEGYDEGEERAKESLKIVLKVGGTDQISDVSFHEEKKRKHKKKKKKRARERSRHAEEDEEDLFEPPVKRAILDLDDESNSSAFSQDVPRRSMRQLPDIKDDEKGILRESLLYIQKHLQRKDVNGFFGYPVNDVIAPGYSQIIREPMDFSTMQTKIENDVYDSIMDYKNDYVLMCNNAMTYNRPETIYYKEAKTLLQSGMKMMSKEKLLSMKRSLGFMSSITMEEIGLNQKDNTNAVLEEINAKEKEYEITVKNRDKIGRFEAFPDNMTAGEILAQARAAAQEARDMLAIKPIKNKLSFLNKMEDSTTSLTIINTDNDGIVGENEKTISLDAHVEKLILGTGNIAGFREDKRNRANHINYLSYGPFSTGAPTYNTSFSNISKEESDLLLSTYGDEAGVQYAQSVMKFVEDAKADCTRIVDSLLDVLTKGQHSSTKKRLQQKQKERTALTSQNENSVTQAEKVTSQLTQLVKKPMPSYITSLSGIRKAMGIGVEAVISTDESQPIEVEDHDDDIQSETMFNQDKPIYQSEMFAQNKDNSHCIDNELLTAAEGTVIDNL